MSRREDAAVVGIVGAAHAASHFCQLVFPPLFPLMKDTFGVSYAALGLMLTAFYVLSAVPQPIAGFIVDRYGGRKVLAAGVGLQAIGLLTIALAPHYWMLIVGAALAGLGNSVYHPADFSIINARVTESRLGHAFSAHGMAGSLGFAAAPFFSGLLGALYGWRSTLVISAAVTGTALVLILVNFKRLAPREAPRPAAARPSSDLSVLFVAPVVLCFLYFAIYAAGLAGLQGFSVSAMSQGFGVAAAYAAFALTCYMVGHATGTVCGGFIATRTHRHDRVAAIGLAGSAATILLVAMKAVPGPLLPVAFAFAGFSVGATAPSRDLIVKASTPPGATGRVYGFVYSGLDVGAFAVPVFYGWLMDRQMTSAVFYTVAAFTAVAIMTVLSLPGRRKEAAA